MIEFVGQGFVIGLAAAAPVGPIALLIVRRTLTDGRIAGMVSGLGAATADLICGCIAAFALSAITTLIQTHRHIVQFVGGAFMIGLGLHTMYAKLHDTVQRPVHERSLTVAYFSTCVLTVANPLTLMGLTGLVAAAGWAHHHANVLQTEFLVAGIVLGSCTWWAGLVLAANWLGRKLGPTVLRGINRWAGGLIVAVGVWQLIAVVRMWAAD